MKTIFVKLSAIALKASFMLFVLTAAPAFAQEAVGDWTGLLAGQLHIIVHITKSADGLYSGSLESPDQGTFVLPMEKIEVTPNHLAFSIPKIDGSYEGTWDAGKKSWVGTWHQGQYIPFNLTRLDSKALNSLKAKRPQEEAIASASQPDQQHEVTSDNSSVASSTQQMDHISVKVMGTTGSPVFLIPGISVPRATWDGIALELAKTHRVYLVQINGFGGDAPGANLNPGILTGTVADLYELISSRMLYHVSVVGHSMGGILGLMLASRHPESVERLMVVDEVPFSSVLMFPPGTDVTVSMVEPRAAQARDAVAAGYGKPPDPAAVEANVARVTLNPENRAILKEWAMAADPRVTAQALYENLTTDLRPELAAIRASVTVVYAWNDKYPLKEQADPFFHQQYAAVQRITYVGIGQSAHVVMLDQPAKFQEAVERFLSK
jgi:pimeloyl-ACP methyl ester carboxylesterase